MNTIASSVIVLKSTQLTVTTRRGLTSLRFMAKVNTSDNGFENLRGRFPGVCSVTLYGVVIFSVRHVWRKRGNGTLRLGQFVVPAGFSRQPRPDRLRFQA